MIMDGSFFFLLWILKFVSGLVVLGIIGVIFVFFCFVGSDGF